MEKQSITVTPGSAEKHVLEGNYDVLRNDFNPERVVKTDITMPTPIPEDRGNIVAFVVPQGKQAALKHPVHPDVNLEGDFHVTSIQTEYNPLNGGIQDAWD